MWERFSERAQSATLDLLFTTVPEGEHASIMPSSILKTRESTCRILIEQIGAHRNPQQKSSGLVGPLIPKSFFFHMAGDAHQISSFIFDLFLS